MEFLSEFDYWMFLAGLGIFIFGMHMLEESIRVLSGAAFRSLIRRYTGSRIKAIFSGIISTAVLQSSSAVSLMVLAFVGAGVMNLVQAIAVMMGTKIGTTATAWIVAIFGFKFNIDAFSLPLIGIGGLGIILLAKSPRYVNISKFLVAFGFLFMGLDFMKTSVEDFSEFIDPEALARYGVLLFALVGLAMTAIMQSSSATIAIVLTMLFSGLITFEAGAAMVIGANVGTTVTVLLGSLGGIHTKKQAAVSQLVFTFGTAIAALLILPLLSWLVLTGFGFASNLVLGLALFHTIFNVMGVMIFYPMVPSLAKKAEQWIPEHTIQLSSYIHKTDPEIHDAGIEAFRKEIYLQLNLSLSFIRVRSGLANDKNLPGYHDLEKYHAEIFEYYTRLHSYEMKQEESEVVDKLLRVSRGIMNVCKNINESANDLIALRNEGDEIHQSAWNSIRIRLNKVTGIKNLFTLSESGELGFSDNMASKIERLHQYIDEEDKEFIRMCGQSFTLPDIKKEDITSHLMLNRAVTQSCRMLIFGVKALLEAESTGQKTLDSYIGHEPGTI
jgi:phosphate:Na+ symporter